MEIAFLDTSALVKRYHIEKNSTLIDSVFDNCSLIISELSLVEFVSAINKKVSERILSKEDSLKILKFFREESTNFIILKFDSYIINSAVEVAIKYNLKTLDSLQLAFALKLKEHNPIFISFDKKLNEAAKIEGFKLSI